MGIDAVLPRESSDRLQQRAGRDGGRGLGHMSGFNLRAVCAARSNPRISLRLGAGLGLSPRVVGAEIPQMALWIAAGIKTPAVILIFDLHDDLGTGCFGARIKAPVTASSATTQ